jgi:hypothetical protein
MIGLKIAALEQKLVTVVMSCEVSTLLLLLCITL